MYFLILLDFYDVVLIVIVRESVVFWSFVLWVILSVIRM